MKTINFGEKKPLVQMKVNELIKFGNENKSSNRLILKTGTLIRHEFGRNTVERTKEKTLPKMKVGMAEILYSPAASSFSSTSTFKKTTLDIDEDISSTFGAMTLQGPHQVA